MIRGRSGGLSRQLSLSPFAGQIGHRRLDIAMSLDDPRDLDSGPGAPVENQKAAPPCGPADNEAQYAGPDIRPLAPHGRRCGNPVQLIDQVVDERFRRFDAVLRDVIAYRLESAPSACSRPSPALVNTTSPNES